MQITSCIKCREITRNTEKNLLKLSINQLYSGKGCTILRLHIFTDASEETILIVAMFISSERQGDTKTHLCDRKMPCSTYKIHDDSEMRISNRNLRSSSRNSDFETSWSENWQSLLWDRFIYRVTLVMQILRHNDLKIDKVYYGTDSSTVLHWLQSAHEQQQVFVANRAAEILENFSMDQWRHVKGLENPADIGTRGMSIEGVTESGWINGPAWLQTAEEK